MSKTPHGLSKYDALVRECTNGQAGNAPLPQVFGRISQHNPVSGNAPDGLPFDAKKTIHAFTKALDGMKDKKDPEGPAEAGMTFFGQFIDHDITLDATSSIGKRIDPRSIRNVRTPTLDLDCVYGDGIEASSFMYHPEHKGFLLFGNKKNPLDLARNSHGTALIGDFRNDENGIISQIQGAFICLHNICMSGSMDNTAMSSVFEGVRSKAMRDHMTPGAKDFEAARRAVRLHYQWLVVNDFLPSFVDAAVLNNVHYKLQNGQLPTPFKKHSPVMPIEFSGAAYRFGHATVQNEYTLNDKLGKVGLFDEAFRGFGPRRADHTIEFKRLFDFPGNHTFDKARPIGRKLPASIFDLPFIEDGLEIDGVHLALKEAKKLPHRNVFRDRFALELASGQQVARQMGVPEISAPKELTAKGITKTPLWYYCLHEAESCGGKLGPVGGTIVATTILRLLYLDHESVLCSAHDFKPWKSMGAGPNGEYSMGRMLDFVEKNRDNIDHKTSLYQPG